MKKSNFLFIFYIFVQWSIFSAGAQTQYTKQLSSDFITLQESDYPITTDGIPYFAQVFQLDTLCQQKDIAVELLYPEWQPLSIEEKRALAKYNIKVETLKIQHHLSTSRKRSVVEISFSPIALVNGRVMRLTSAKIQIKILQIFFIRKAGFFNSSFFCFVMPVAYFAAKHFMQKNEIAYFTSFSLMY